LMVLVCACLVVCLAQEEPGDGPAPRAGGEVALRVNGQEVSRAQFRNLLLEYKERSFLEELVDHILVEQAAAKAGISLSEREVDKRVIGIVMDELAECGNDLDKFGRTLQLYGCTVDERKKALRRELKWTILAEELVRRERSSEEKLKELFEKRYPRNAGRVAKVHHILISAEEMRRGLTAREENLERRSKVASEAGKKDIAAEQESLKKKLKAWEGRNSKEVADQAVKRLRSGEDFSAVAAECGAGYTAETYDMGWVTREWVFSLLAPIIFDQLKVGEVGEPVQSRYGFHVVKLVDIRDVSKLKYEEVRPYLKDELSSSVVSKAEIAGLIARMRQEARIERPMFQNAGGDGSGK
jgi:parvulin-like peptidyl-prolyl isomerase